MTSDEEVLRPDREKLLLPIVFFGFAAAVGWWMDSTGEPGGSFVLVASCAFVAAGVVQILPNAAWLKLTPEGFQIRSFFVTRKLVRWRDVQEFFIVKVRGAPCVAYNFRYSYVGKQRSRKFSQATFGADGSVPTYGPPPETLMAVMEDWRVRATTPASPTPR